MIPTDFVQDSDGDLALPLRRTETLSDFVVQSFSQKFNYWKGEWFLDLNGGLPMFELILGQPYDPPLVQSIFRKAALLVKGVADIESLITEFDTTTRTLSVQPFAVSLIDGTEIPDPGPFHVEIP